jgi:hypothetical protein
VEEMSEVYYARYPALVVAGVMEDADGEEQEITVDFSGNMKPPGQPKGVYVTADEGIITWLDSHPAYGFDFAKTPFSTPAAPPKMYSRDDLVDILLQALVWV